MAGSHKHIPGIEGHSQTRADQGPDKSIYERLHVLPGTGIRQYDLLVTKSTFYRRDYGDEFMNALAQRLRPARPREAEIIHSLRSVVMDPWPAETEVEGSQVNFFEAIIIPTLREIVCECVEALDPVGEDTGQL